MQISLWPSSKTPGQKQTHKICLNLVKLDICVYNGMINRYRRYRVILSQGQGHLGHSKSSKIPSLELEITKTENLAGSPQKDLTLGDGKFQI